VFVGATVKRKWLRNQFENNREMQPVEKPKIFNRAVAILLVAMAKPTKYYVKLNSKSGIDAKRKRNKND
jgi:hypothetical protein